MCCILFGLTVDDTWKCTSIFYIVVKCEDEVSKIVTDGDNCMNVISTTVHDEINLTHDPHPHLYKVAWLS